MNTNNEEKDKAQEPQEPKTPETPEAAGPVEQKAPEEPRGERFSRRKRKPKKNAPPGTSPEGEEGEGSSVAADNESIEKVVAINRITKVTKGGKKLSFSALVIVGDGKGKVGFSLSKAAEVSVAIRKSMANAKKRMTAIQLKGTTIAHEIIGQCGGARVLLKPAGDGTGVIAAGPVRAVCDAVGIKNILTKCHKSNNPINVVKATLDGLTRIKTRTLEKGQE